MPTTASRSARRLIVVLAALATVVARAPARADTLIYGGDVESQTWTPAGSPYVVLGDVRVNGDKTLIIQPGTTVLFVGNDFNSAGEDPLRVELIVGGGELYAQGTSANPIVFRAQTGTAAGIWYGVVGLVGTMQLDHVEVRNAVKGLDIVVQTSVSVSSSTFATNETGIAVSSDGLTVQNVAFTSNGTALAVSGGAPTIVDAIFTANTAAITCSGGEPLFRNLTVSGNGNGILLTGASAASLENAVISGNTGYGIFMSPSAGTVTNIRHATIHGNGTYGIGANGSHVAAQRSVTNSIVTGNQYGIYRSATDTAALDVTYSDVWNNSAADYAGLSPGVETLSVDPDYVAAPADLHLRATSPAVDAAAVGTGHPLDRDGRTRPLDGDGFGGAQPDMGAYEFDPTGLPIDRIFADDFEAGS